MNIISQKYTNLSKPVRATLWFTVCNILQKGILFLAVPIYTRIMSTEQYGVYSVFLSWLEIFEIIATFRLGWGGYVVGLTKYESERDEYTSSLQCLSIVITFFFMVIYLFFSDRINAFTDLDNTLTLMIFGNLFSMTAIQFWTVRNRVEYKYKTVLYITVASSALTLLCGILFAIISVDKAKAVIFARVLVQGIEGIILIWINCHNKFTFFNKTYWQRAFTFNVPLLPYYLSLVLLHSSDRIIIKNLIGSTQAGIYGVAYSISTCMQLFNSALTQTVQPWLYSRIKENNVKDVPKIINFTFLIVAGLNVLLIALAPELISFVAPVEYQEAIWIIPPLSASVVVMYFYQHFVNIEFYFEESRLTAIASIGAAFLNIILNIKFIPIYGYFAAGYTTFISYLVFAIVHYFFMKVVCKKKNYNQKLVDIKKMTVVMLLFILCVLLLMIVYNNALFRYGIIIVYVSVLVMKKNTLIEIIERLRK